MKAIHIDAKTSRPIEAHAVAAAYTVGFISWRRLAEVLAAAGETKPSEQVVSYQIDERGISFRVVT